MPIHITNIEDNLKISKSFRPKRLIHMARSYSGNIFILVFIFIDWEFILFTYKMEGDKNDWNL